jgi:hypothetical protein
MEYFDEILDRSTGELVTVSKGDWITVTELGEVFGVKRREVRTMLRKMGVLVTEGAATHQRHRLAAWVVQQGWGKRIEKRGAIPFDVVSPELRQWIAERWEQTKDDIASEATSRSLVAREALLDFQSSRNRPDLTVQQKVHWLADFHPKLTQAEVAMVLDVTQQLVSKFLNARTAARREMEVFKNTPLPDLEPDERWSRQIAGTWK